MSQALSWKFGTVDSQSGELLAGSNAADGLAADLATDAERTLDAMSGNSIGTARDETGKLVRRARKLSDHLETTGRTLSTFYTSAEEQQRRLRLAVESATSERCTVAEGGTVMPPPGDDDSRGAGNADAELEIKNALTALSILDSDVADELSDLHGSVADYSDASDPKTAIAGGIFSSIFAPLGDLIGEDGYRSTRYIAKGLGPFGNLLGFSAGVAGSPDDEPMSETLAAETAGLAAGVATGAATGAAIGSIVPVAGTAIGGLIGVAVGG